MQVRFYMKITLLCHLVSAHCQTIKNKGHDNDQSKYDVVQLAEEIFTYTKGSILSVYYSIETKLLYNLDGLLRFIFYLIFTLADQLVRQPINIVNQILHAFSWTLDGIVYILVDVFLHSFIEEGFYIVVTVVSKFTSIYVTLIIQLLLCLILGIILVFKKYILIPYLNQTSDLYRVIILPSFEPVFWTLSYLPIIYLALFVIFCMEQEQRNEYGIKVIFIFFLIVISVCYLWMPFCSVILKYVCYPALEPLYYLGTTYLLCRIIKPLLSSKLHIFNGIHDCVICFNKRPLVTLFPCKHNSICLKCHNQLLINDYRCPLCRAEISHYKGHLVHEIIKQMSHMRHYE